MTGATRCICGHLETTHVFDCGDSVCAKEGCSCMEYHRWECRIESPRGVRFDVTCVEAFVRDHRELFDWEDTEHKQTPYSDRDPRRKAAYYTVAAHGLRSMIERHTETWKGWSVIVFPKTFKISPVVRREESQVCGLLDSQVRNGSAEHAPEGETKTADGYVAHGDRRIDIYDNHGTLIYRV